jgi:leucyl aminopeptidase (aminopeptidase T)
MEGQIKKAVNNIFKTNLAVKQTEKVIVLTDEYNKEIRKIGKLVAEAGKNHTTNIKHIKYRPTGCHGVEPPEQIWTEAFGDNICRKLKQKKLLKPLLLKKISGEKLKEVESIVKAHKKEAVDVVIALSFYSTSHTRFRDILNRICDTRYASMPLFDGLMLTGAMGVNWQKMLSRTKTIANMVNKYDDMEIQTPNGTCISLSKKGRQAHLDTGIITKRGDFSNLPAGEVFFAPLEGSATGRLVVEWAPTRKLKKPITLHIKKGMVAAVEGKEKYVDYLERKLSEKNENRNIAEIGIGTNDKAARPDNILESEKILGTIHIALGDNSSFGGKVRTSFHQDFVFFKPTVTLISKNGVRSVLLKDGKLSRSSQ